MTRSVPPLARVAAAALLAATVACQDAAEETPEAVVLPADVPAAPSVAPPAAEAGAFLDPNAATREQLVAVPGVTPAAADALIAGRPYTNNIAVERVLVAQQLGDAQRDTVFTRLWIPIDLNTASAEEIELIPGVGPRMRHEFEEYRPYTSMAQFRREIGKYVDEAEVARLERYVVLR